MLNRIRLTSYLFSAILIITSLSISGCDFSEIKSQATTGDLSITSDESLKQLMLEEEAEFERLNKEANVELKFLPTRYVTAALINGDVSMITTVGDFTDEEKKAIKDNNIEIQKHEFAVDGIAFIVNPNNPVQRVTSEDLKKIFTGEYTKWGQIESQDAEQNLQVKSKMTGKNENIKVFIQRPNSDMYSFVRDTVLNGMEYWNKSNICSTSVQMLEDIRKNDNAIGISNLGWLGTGNQDILDSTVRPLRVSRIYPNGFQDDFKQFHQGLVFNQEYPYRRIVYAFTTDKGIKLSSGFITFLLNKDGQKVVLKVGMVPVTQPVRTLQIN